MSCASIGLHRHHRDTSRERGHRSWHARSVSAHWKAAAPAAIENPPQAVQRPVARARHLADVPPQQDQRHMGAQGQRRARRILDQGLRASRRLRGQRRQERADVLSGAGRGEEAGARRGRQRRHRTDHGRWRAERLQDAIWKRAVPIPTTPNGRACISPACCCPSRWHCSPPPS